MMKAFGLSVPLLVNAVVSAATIRVDPSSSTSGPGDATNWTNAYDNLDDAIANSQLGDELWLADGVYTVSVRMDIGDARSATFLIPGGIKLLGGFQGIGVGETLKSQRNPDLYEAVLRGEIGNSECITDNAYHVVTVIGGDADDTTIISGVTIRDGHAGTNGFDFRQGGGIFVGEGAWPVFARCKIVSNSQTGAAIANAYLGEDPIIPADGPVRFLACTFADNHSDYHGGGLFTYEVVACELYNCLAYSNEAGPGSAFDLAGGSSKKLSQNPLPLGEGRVRAVQNREIVREYRNQTPSPQPSPKGRESFETVSKVVNCIVTGNFANGADENGRGAIQFYTGSDETNLIINCVVYGNTNLDGSGEVAQVPHGEWLTVSNSVVEDLDYYLGNNNVGVDPLFVNAGGDEYRLQYLSTVLNNADSGEMVADTYDIDDDSNTTEALPDLAMGDRKVNPTSCLDRGAFENQVPPSCDGDITGGTNGEPDGVVDDDDLDLIDVNWDLYGTVANVDGPACGVVDVDDLLFVLNNWGNCNSFAPPSYPEWLEDCITKCGEDTEGIAGCIREHFDE